MAQLPVHSPHTLSVHGSIPGMSGSSGLWYCNADEENQVTNIQKKMNSKRNSLIRSKKGTKRKQNNVQQKKMKKVSKRKGFTIDTRSSSVVSMSGKQSQKNISVTNKRHALGYDSLEERERSLATDLFGEDAELPGSLSQEVSSQDVSAATGTKRKTLEMIPDDPFDIHEPVMKNRKKPAWVDDEERISLATDLFGEDAALPGSLSQEVSSQDVCAATGTKRDTSEMIPDDPFDVHEPVKKNRKPAWVDDDDETIRVKDVVASMTKARGKRGIRENSDVLYEMKLKEKFSQVIGSTPEWAELGQKKKGDSDDEDEMARSTGNYLSGASSVNLPKIWLEYKKLPHLNSSSRSEGAIIKAVEFNPHFQVGLVAGFSGSVIGAATLFQVDGVHNFKIQSVKFPKFPIKCAKFMQDGKQFIVGSNLHNHFYVYDMEAAKEMKIHCSKMEEKRSLKSFVVSPDGKLLVFLGTKGHLHIYDTTTLSHINTLYSPEDLTSAAFSENGSKMYTNGSGGDVFIWDMNSLACVHRFIDDGCIDGTSIAVSPGNQYLACGSSSGVVNVYDMASVSNKTPCPVKILDKLVTPVSALTFNSSTEILAMASEYLDNAVKLVHFPSMTYFNNFPGRQYSMRRVQILNFSPKSGFLAAGNNIGGAFLYRLKHFSSY
ncbi:U3 small nucleolar RNA-associated protein 18 homolog isoform X2 [Cherax quadricarinatus]|uniref:U3 small nucleolar RNA-associated protein 18 homolog isoform X2 n=1 Tax=Cherax quadricarinatus TaxID=27406 RepID=UPI0023795EA2|nr:U3 small nucleolar RNA-associated protein 18 homolog isoform X2 [Cherax quadricarinatus]